MSLSSGSASTTSHVHGPGRVEELGCGREIPVRGSAVGEQRLAEFGGHEFHGRTPCRSVGRRGADGTLPRPDQGSMMRVNRRPKLTPYWSAPLRVDKIRLRF